MTIIICMKLLTTVHIIIGKSVIYVKHKLKSLWMSILFIQKTYEVGKPIQPISV